MKTKALLLTLMALVAFSCSNDDNGSVEEQEEQVELKIKKLVHHIYPAPTGINRREYLFDEIGRLIRIDEIVPLGTDQYEIFEYDNQSRLIRKNFFFIDEVEPYWYYEYNYDTSNKLESVKIISDSFEDPVASYFFEYEGNKIIVILLDIVSSTVGEYHYYFNNNKLNRYSSFFPAQHVDVELSYVENNITYATGYSGDYNFEHFYEYDDKINPLFNLTENRFFYWDDGLIETNRRQGSIFFSQNNIKKYTLYINSEVGIANIEIEYNENNYPVYSKWIIEDNQIVEELHYEYY